MTTVRLWRAVVTIAIALVPVVFVFVLIFAVSHTSLLNRWVRAIGRGQARGYPDEYNRRLFNIVILNFGLGACQGRNAKYGAHPCRRIYL